MHVVLHIHTCNNLYFCVSLSLLKLSCLWNYTLSCDPPLHPIAHGCKCVFWRWKSCLYSFVVSGLRINQITAMVAAPPPPPPHSCSSNCLPSPARGYWPSRGPGSAGGGPRSVSRLQMLLSIGLCVPQMSPMPGDQTHYCWSDIKTNREEWKPLNTPCSQSHDSPC